jgi:hypothetical protein
MPGEIDPFTGRKVRLHIGHIVDKHLGGKEELSNLRAPLFNLQSRGKEHHGRKADGGLVALTSSSCRRWP